MKPLLIIPIADPHTGSTVGLHPNYVMRDNQWITIDEAGGWRYKHNENYYPNSKQKRIWKHYETTIRGMAQLREQLDADIFIPVMGDAIDGDHHGTYQLTTRVEHEQMLAHIEIIKWTRDILGWREGDRQVYIEGTESHTKDNEEYIAQYLTAMKFGNTYCTPFLEMVIFGKLFWFFHTGVAAGYSFVAGSGLYNYLRKIYIDRRMNGLRPPDFILTAHTHQIDHQSYRHNGHELQGIIVPPLQEKTRYTNSIASVLPANNKVGISPVIVYPNGWINVIPPFLSEAPLGEVLTW